MIEDNNDKNEELDKITDKILKSRTVVISQQVDSKLTAKVLNQLILLEQEGNELPQGIPSRSWHFFLFRPYSSCLEDRALSSCATVSIKWSIFSFLEFTESRSKISTNSEIF